MRYGSVCSGIEAATAAWHPLGWQPAFFSEIEKFPRAVLQHHYPDVPLHGDFTTIGGDEYGSIDLLVGGTPCQSFSVAGLRKGLSDERGNLALEFIKLADRAGPKWIVWENVPGVLSSSRGRDFGSLLGALAELGYGYAWRVLDAQYCGVAQRRRRVFLVGHLGDWRRAAEVLFERESLSGNPAPSRKEGEAVAPTLSARTKGGGGLGTDFECDGGVIASTGEISHCLNAGGMGRQDYETETLIAHTLRGEGFDASEDGTGRGTPLVPVSFSCKGNGRDATSDLSPTLRSMGHNGSHANGGGQMAVAFHENQREEITLKHVAGTLGAGGGKPGQGYPAIAVSIRGREGGATVELPGDLSPAIRASQGGGDKPHVLTSAVRRLTPIECERLQGFPEQKNNVTIRVWSSESLKRNADAEGIGLRSPKSACNAAGERLSQDARHAGFDSDASRQESDRLVAANVRIDLERSDLQIRNAERSVWSVNTAEKSRKSPLLIPGNAFVRLAALMPAIAGQKIASGVEESPRKPPHSTTRLSGRRLVNLCGQEIGALARNVSEFTGRADHFMRSITSQAGQSSQSYDLILETWSCFVAAAISGCIPVQMWNGNSFDLDVETVCGYTAIPWRGRDIWECPDGPRYKVLGNSMAVPCMAWIGKRIDAITKQTEN